MLSQVDIKLRGADLMRENVDGDTKTTDDGGDRSDRESEEPTVTLFGLLLNTKSMWIRLRMTCKSSRPTTLVA